MKKLLLIFISFLAFYSLLFPQDNSSKILILKKTDLEIKIDGIIDPVWTEADSAINFFQLQPYFDQEPSFRTVAKVISTEEALYCLMICYQPEDMIQTSTGLLDEFPGDVVSIMLDTFGDKQTAYKLAVSASGVRMDSRMLDDARNRDYSWDGIWFGDAKVYDWGYVAEMKIPYKSIKYDKELIEWGIDFDRWIPALGEDLYWCDYEQNEGQRISKFGRLIFKDFKPTVTGINLEIYPVGITKADYLGNGEYDFDYSGGLDVFYNPSQKLTFQLTANPDFAQIEADPFDFNISRYETYFAERRPFFTEGSEIFSPSGKERGSGFYSPLELFYSRRIGKILPGGEEVPLIAGTKAFGRLDEWEYGGFLALTGEKSFLNEDEEIVTEKRAYFGSARLKKQILDNSSIGILMVGKQTKDNTYGVIDIDGAFRGSNWQLSYQLARSIKNSDGDFALSSGFRLQTNDYISLVRLRAIGNEFDVQEIGFVPWRGTTELVGLGGPIWYYDEGPIRQMFMYAGPALYYEHEDLFTDYTGIFGFNMQLRDNWGYEINLSLGNSKDENVEYTSYEASLSSWYNISSNWNGNLYGGYSRTYNFSRDYLAFYSWGGIFFGWDALDILELGTSFDLFIEGNPDGEVEDITYNARPYFSLTPVNDLNFRLYIDNVYVQSTEKLERVIIGFLFAWNFSPKSWVYFAVNEFKDRSEELDEKGNPLLEKLHTTERAAVLKIKYLYYF